MHSEVCQKRTRHLEFLLNNIDLPQQNYSLITYRLYVLKSILHNLPVFVLYRNMIKNIEDEKWHASDSLHW